MSYLKSKYPKTLHLPWSQCIYTDDKCLEDTSQFVGKEVVVTVKMDGENTNMYRDAIHARSPNSGSHSSRDWIKNLHGKIKHMIPNGYRICGENLYAKHSIHYKGLPSYFMMFSVFDHTQKCLSWTDTVEMAYRLDLQLVPVLYKGRFDSELIKNFNKMDKYGQDEMEGYVVRLADSFTYDEHRTSVAKFVRANHIRTPDHWMYQTVTLNLLNPKAID